MPYIITRPVGGAEVWLVLEREGWRRVVWFGDGRGGEGAILACDGGVAAWIGWFLGERLGW